jgi:oxygen-independent coproporphyrinogen-3 oxidase
MNAGLYVHIPFCEIKCGYCDFFVVAHKRPQIAAYLKALNTEVDLYAKRAKIRNLYFDTLYFGGGTPSLLNARQLDTLIQSITSKFNFSSGPEVTVETNPGTVDLNRLMDYRAAGVNRLSLGIQSFHPKELLFLDRTHAVEDIFACLRDARKVGFENINFDLIFGLPGQTLEDWKTSLLRAVELGPEHISTYNLTYEPRTALTRKLQRGQIIPCDEEERGDMGGRRLEC